MTYVTGAMLAVSCAAGLVACASRGPDTTPASASMEIAVQTFSYADGAGNRYQLDGGALTLTYTPVTAVESSSGTYDGGPAWSSALTQAQHDALVALFERALTATAEHRPDRAMGTGVVQDGGSRLVILTMASPVRGELEAQLKGFAE